MKKLRFGLLFGSALVGSALGAWTPAGAQTPPGPPAVGVVRVEKRAVTETEEFIGRIQSVNRVNLTTRCSAKRRFPNRLQSFGILAVMFEHSVGEVSCEEGGHAPDTLHQRLHTL